MRFGLTCMAVSFNILIYDYIISRQNVKAPGSIYGDDMINEDLKNKITERLAFEGADAVYYGYLGGLLPERLQKMPYSISILVRLSDFTADEIINGPTKLYFHNYRTMNAVLDRMTLLAVGMLQKSVPGCNAIAVPASQTEDSDSISGLISHKLAAVHSGAGYIGKSALFISNEFGPAVRLATVLTDVPLAEPVIKYSISLCGDCTLCRDACPAGAILGNNYSEGMERSAIFDAKKCSDYMKKAYQHIGRGAVCGICIGVCPMRKKNR